MKAAVALPETAVTSAVAGPLVSENTAPPTATAVSRATRTLYIRFFIGIFLL
jgi:hypothetical protein